jgi:hypothetical protein
MRIPRCEKVFGGGVVKCQGMILATVWQQPKHFRQKRVLEQGCQNQVAMQCRLHLSVSGKNIPGNSYGLSVQVDPTGHHCPAIT